MSLMILDAAILHMRSDPAYAALVRDAYLGPDHADSVCRYTISSEFATILAQLGSAVSGAVVLDLGAGIGLASCAFLSAGASQIHAVEPDGSELVGRLALAKVVADLPVTIHDAVGEQLPLASGSVDIVFCRQVLHHTRDLPQVLRECHRVLRPGGWFIACREHVCDDEQQLERFLAVHPMHQLAGGENAFSENVYRQAIIGSGLVLSDVWGPWDSLINTFPTVQTAEELARYPRRWLSEKFGFMGECLAWIPGISWLVWKRLRRPVPGRLYTFIARRPEK